MRTGLVMVRLLTLVLQHPLRSVQKKILAPGESTLRDTADLFFTSSFTYQRLLLQHRFFFNLS
jgi:hypothetical protein